MKNIIMIALFIVAFSVDAKAQEAKPSQKEQTCCASACQKDTAQAKYCCADKASCPASGQCCIATTASCGAAAPAEDKNGTATADAPKQACKAESVCCSSGKPAGKA